MTVGRIMAAGLPRIRLGRISRGVNVRALFLILIAAAMLFAPVALQSGAAMAMAPTDHHAQMMEKGHCGDQKGDHHGKMSGGKNCCTAMCSGVAVNIGETAELHHFMASEPVPTPVEFRFNFLAKLPTPPPRAS